MQRDKAFLEVEGIPLWRRQLRLLEELEPSEIFISGPAREEWRDQGCTIIPDTRVDAGPLAGLAATLSHCTTPLLLALAVDLPRMTTFFLRELLTDCTGDETGTVPRLGDCFEPLAATYPRRALALARRDLDANRHALQDFVADCVAAGFVRPKRIAPGEAALFFNLNTPEDLQLLSHE